MFTLFLTTFTTVFLAELGDKTQLATVAISGSSNRPLAVLLGSSCALVLASFFGVVAGSSIAAMIPSDILKTLAALGFLLIGAKLLWPLTKKTEDHL
ncbi:TMEM165/GDT1 family protein [Prochlorococcus sp. MIT 1307]|uniref:TMEM165/GDT1 family protein n=1 Tax=Prochlorococcus sp. MIT 1307 TaxID=3096219 RepID=UPI002A7571A7|nr:TMEM165/GDT1 family protein [Prochlorococcus sp. MIT 1307]